MDRPRYTANVLVIRSKHWLEAVASKKREHGRTLRSGTTLTDVSVVRIATGCNRLRRRVDTGCNTRTLRNTNAPPTSRRVSQTDLRPNKSRAQKGRAKVDPLLLERRHPGASLEAFPRGPRLTADSSIEDETRSQGGGHLFSAHHRSVGASPASPRNWSFLALDEGRTAFLFPQDRTDASDAFQ